MIQEYQAMTLTDRAVTPEAFELWRARASSPDTPLAWLELLVDVYPQEVLKNPVLPLLYLGEPARAHRLSKRAKNKRNEFRAVLRLEGNGAEKLRLCLFEGLGVVLRFSASLGLVFPSVSL